MIVLIISHLSSLFVFRKRTENGRVLCVRAVRDPSVASCESVGGSDSGTIDAGNSSWQ